MIKKRFISMLVLLAAVVTGAWAETIDLSTLTAAYEAQDGDVLTGTLAANVKITIADGATVTLSGAVINGTNSSSWAGLTLAGDGTIILSGENSVKGFYDEYPGISVPANKTLTIQGDGSLTASSNGWAAGIGGGYEKACGNITIEGGTITATGGSDAAGIGGGYNTSCGDISITGGTVTATGGNYAAGIGSGSSDGYDSSCGNITITDGVTKVTATAGQSAPNSIGVGMGGSCGTVTIGGVVYPDGISDSPFTYEGNPTAASTYTVTLKEGTDDADNWTITPAEATTTGVAAGTEVTATYSGTKKVKSVKAKKKAPAGPTAYTLAESTLGMVVGTDGKAYAMADKDNLPTGVTAAGVVVYKNGANGLAIALTDEASMMDWATACGESGAAAHTPTVEGCSWKLPSQEEWTLVKNANSGSSLNSAITNAGGTAIPTVHFDPETETLTGQYWLSTENSYNTDIARVWGINAYDEIAVGDANQGLKTDNLLVRACLAW